MVPAITRSQGARQAVRTGARSWAHEPRGRMSDRPAKPPRFPREVALLCAACVGMAGYLWMRYSYCWDTAMPMLVAARELPQERDEERGGVS